MSDEFEDPLYTDSGDATDEENAECLMPGVDCGICDLQDCCPFKELLEDDNPEHEEHEDGEFSDDFDDVPSLVGNSEERSDD